MTTRCKFLCVGVTKRLTSIWDLSGKYSQGFACDAAFQVVSSGSEENKKFFASTPSGDMKLCTYREDQFEPGKEYYLDITPA